MLQDILTDRKALFAVSAAFGVLTIIGKNYRRSNHEFEDEPLFLPHISQSTEIPTGICILAHNVETVRMKSSNDD